MIEGRCVHHATFSTLSGVRLSFEFHVHSWHLFYCVPEFIEAETMPLSIALTSIWLISVTLKHFGTKIVSS